MIALLVYLSIIAFIFLIFIVLVGIFYPLKEFT